LDEWSKMSIERAPGGIGCACEEMQARADYGPTSSDLQQPSILKFVPGAFDESCQSGCGAACFEHCHGASQPGQLQKVHHICGGRQRQLGLSIAKRFGKVVRQCPKEISEFMLHTAW
jgi:hypothetical protein